MKILIFIEHDIIIRHFIHSGIFDKLISEHEVTFIFPEKGHKRVNIDVECLDLGAPYRYLTVNQKRQQLWKWIFFVDSLRWRPGEHYAAMRRFHRNTIGPKKIVFLFSIFSLPVIFSIFRFFVLLRIWLMPYRELEKLIQDEDPDMFIHPSVLAGVYINDLVLYSRKENIPLIVIMNSWDNPSTKRAMTGQPNWLLVWGEQTKQHAIKYMGMKSEKVVCFGAAQFDVYRHLPRISRDKFCTQHNIDLNHKIILYAGSSKGSNEYSHLCKLDEAITSGLFRNITIVYRPHPWGDGGNNGARIIDHPWKNIRIEESMRGYLEKLKMSTQGITTPDYRDTHDVLSSVDAVISPLSTILIEAALHGKPVMCFLPIDEEAAAHLNLTLPLTHFDDFFKNDIFIVSKGIKNLLSGVSDLIQKIDEPLYHIDLKNACNYFVRTFEDMSYGDRLNAFIKDNYPAERYEKRAL